MGVAPGQKNKCPKGLKCCSEKDWPDGLQGQRSGKCAKKCLSKFVISKGTWPKNLKDTREKIRKCKAGEKEGQVISKEKSGESIENRGKDGERSHEVGKFEAGKTKSR